MTIDEAIKIEENIAEKNQRVVDTGIVFDDVTIDMLYCDDTEVIEEHLSNYQKYTEEHRQLAEWLKELKKLKEKTEPQIVYYIYDARFEDDVDAYCPHCNELLNDYWGCGYCLCCGQVLEW